MTARGHRRTAIECRTKTKAMRYEFKRVQQHNRGTGNERATCPYFDELQRILRVDVSVQHGRVARSYTLKAPQRGRGAERRHTRPTVQQPTSTPCESFTSKTLQPGKTHELMAERTEVLRRMADLRLQQQGKRGQRRGAAGPTSTTVLTHSQLKELPRPPSPELFTCSKPLERAAPTPPVHGKRGQRRGPAGPTAATVLTHSQLKELARPPSPELLTCSKPLERAAPTPPVHGKRGQRRGPAGPTAATVLTHSQLKELARPPSPELLTCSQSLEWAAPAPPVRGKRGQRRAAAGPTPSTAPSRSQLEGACWTLFP
uniref:Uncharacterized protein n=1 Tax=Sphaerodactylus townsendi TaxID=933632 RepID=A0ACB8E898_9SAUR